MIKLQVKYGLCGLFLLFLSTTNAQETKNTLGVGANYHYGFISPHNVLVNEIIKEHTQMYQLDFFKETTGKNQWEQYYNYPRIGVSAVFINSGNPESLGNMYGVFPYIDFPLNQWKITWDFKFGAGLGFVEKPFDRTDNYKNLVIGSHLNALIYADTHWEFQLSKRIKTSLGVALTHFSNGSLKRPNLGINIFSAHYGFSYNFGNKENIVAKNDEIREKKFSHVVLGTFGLKEVDPIGGRKYMVYNASYNLLRTITNKSTIGVGVDFFYNTSLEPLIVRLQHEDLGKLGNLCIGLSGIYALEMGKVSLMFQTGFYGYKNYKSDANIYTRIGTRYRLNDKIFFNLGLKTHFFVADFIEYGIGYQLK